MWRKLLWPIVSVVLTLLPLGGYGQEEVAGRFRHYRSTEMSTGLYEDYEVRPRGIQLHFAEPDRSVRGISRAGEEERRAWNRIFLNDAHVGIPVYEYRRCVDCHPANANNRHTVRHGITCRQCHGGEPISSVKHYFSRLNPTRKHTHVCAQCHVGAGASFALYAVHEPNPGQISTRETIPVLFYAFWIMVIIAGGVFLVFLPHTAAWGVRELMVKRKKEKR